MTGILLMFELTRNYDIALPLILTVAIGTLTIDLIDYSNVNPTWGWWWGPSLPVPGRTPSVAALPPSLPSAPLPQPSLAPPADSSRLPSSARQEDRDRVP